MLRGDWRPRAAADKAFKNVDAGFWRAPESRAQLQCGVGHICRACATISVRTLLASAGLLTYRENAMRAPRGPSAVFNRINRNGLFGRDTIRR